MVSKPDPIGKPLAPADSAPAETVPGSPATGGVHLQSLLEHLQEVVFVLTGQGTVEYINPSILHLTGHIADELIGQDFQQLVYHHDLPNWEEALRQLKDHPIPPLECRLTKKSGGTVWVRMVLSALQNEQQTTGVQGSVVNITQEKSVEDQVAARLEQLLAKELKPQAIRLREILDIPKLQVLLDRFCATTGAGAAILDADSEVLVGVGWQKICTHFHRVHPVACQRCHESDMYINTHLPSEGWVEYKCQNGLWDIALPICIEGEHLGTFFLGQFFYEGEQPDREYFRRQAREFGFDETAYLNALDEVPVFSRTRVENIMLYYQQLVDLLVSLGAKTFAAVNALKERDRVNEELKHQAHYLSHILDVIPDVVGLLSPDHTILNYNQAGLDLLNRPLDDVIGHKCYALLGRTTPCERCSFHKTLETGQPASHENYYPELDRWLESRTMPLFDKQGNIEAVLELLRDITEERQAAEALRKSQERFRAVIDHAPDMIAIMGLDGKFRDINWAALTRYGYSREEFLEMSPTDLNTDPHKKMFEERFQKLLAEGMLVFETEHRTRSNELIPLEIKATLIPFGEEQAVLVVGRDLTERKRVEAEQKQLEENLRHAQKMEAVGQLAGGVAHDFNNLLQVIKGYQELCLLDMPKDSPFYDYIKESQDASTKAATLVRQLLAFSRREVLQIERLQINDILNSSLKMLRRLIGENIELVFLEGSIPDLLADPGQVEQILINLCVNARDAMPHGGQIKISTAKVMVEKHDPLVSEELSPGEYCLLEVQDSGPGIAEEIRERIFEPFFTTKGVGEGTGLGLATVYAIAKRHEGMVQIASTSDAGTTFRVYLPCCPKQIEEPTTDTPESTSPAAGQGEMVLMAEDDEQVRRLNALLLEREGYRVLIAKNGADAIQQYEKHKELIRLVILDVIMPQKSGREVMQHIRQTDSHIPIVFVSGYSFNVLKSEGFPQPGVHLLYKPVDHRELKKLVRQLITHPTA